MKHFLVDTNVVIDFLTERSPFSLEAIKLFDLASKGKVKLYLAAVSYNNIYYIVRKFEGHSATLKVLKLIDQLTEVVDTSRSIISDSLNSGFKDFEDAMQYFSAQRIKRVDGIVTRNRPDFKLSELPILSPGEAISLTESAAR